ncbi:hypothetical protein PUN28_005261 [Cardiocondyla obscurior]|uniref:Uncharacterized protein n=1 Tax=Cardiocondyla obscurior TaxID=286306 RepID=A0AAW2GFK7_9HYME
MRIAKQPRNFPREKKMSWDLELVSRNNTPKQRGRFVVYLWTGERTKNGQKRKKNKRKSAWDIEEIKLCAQVLYGCISPEKQKAFRGPRLASNNGSLVVVPVLPFAQQNSTLVPPSFLALLRQNRRKFSFFSFLFFYPYSSFVYFQGFPVLHRETTLF